MSIPSVSLLHLRIYFSHLLVNSCTNVSKRKQRKAAFHYTSSRFLTYSGPVLPDQPQMVAKEGENADAEHGCHKEKEQDVEFGVCVGQLVLGE